MGVMLRPGEDPMPTEEELARLAGLVPGHVDREKLEALRRDLDEKGFIVMGGQADKVSEAVAAGWQGALDFAGAIRLALAGLVADKETTTLPPSAVEVAVLDRGSESSRGTRRAFRRLEDADITALLAEEN